MRRRPAGSEFTVRELAWSRLGIGPMEAIDGTPVVDPKPVFGRPER